MKRFSPRLLPDFSWGRLGLILLGSAIASFGLYNIHQQCGITEGGVLGSVLLLHAGHGTVSRFKTGDRKDRHHD